MDINALLARATELGASDLHLAPPGRPRIRLKGLLADLPGTEALSQADLASVMETVAGEQQRKTFLERKELDIGYSLPGVGRFRINISLQQASLAFAFRLLPLAIPSIERLGLPSICRELVLRPRGLVLVTGPTGSGKSTTLAAMIEHINQTECRRIITIEDPIEYVYAPAQCQILQREIGRDSNSFADALRHVLRQDPNIVLIGEMRDLETISIALTAAETGQLVLATLHTNSASQAVDRIINVFPPHQQDQVRLQLSMVLEGVMAQVLLPRADGKGRVAAVEVMLANDAVRSLIREGKSYELPNYIQMGRKQGMQNLDWALAELVSRGLVTREQAMARAQRWSVDSSSALRVQ
ncbi:MAG: type IV pilus twitching motility protein PilT [Chloroflexi bacterium]|nr:type IV pilus twitching motility protein PilT [Chloroflexota bacterium]